MGNQQKRIESERLTNAYRAWASHIKSTRPGSANIIFMDDLSNVPQALKGNDLAAEWAVIFEQTLQSTTTLTADETLKIHQSLEFSRFMDEPPTRKTVEACGGKFEDQKVVLADIEELTRQIDEMESSKLPEFPSNSDTSYECALKIAKHGFEYISSKCDGFKSLDFEIRQLDPSSPFVAQVITDVPGQIVCEIPFDRPVNSAFAGLMIHEILGHVFHFSQLKNSPHFDDTPHLLCLSLHTHEGFFIEAVSQLITSYLSIKSSWEIPGKEQIALYDLKYQRTQAVAHYLVTMLIDGKVSLKEAVQFHYDCSKGSMSAEFLESRYKILTQSLFTMKSTLNYYPSFRTVKPLLELTERKFFDSLKEMVDKYFTPKSLEEFVVKKLR